MPLQGECVPHRRLPLRFTAMLAVYPLVLKREAGAGDACLGDILVRRVPAAAAEAGQRGTKEDRICYVLTIMSDIMGLIIGITCSENRQRRKPSKKPHIRLSGESPLSDSHFPLAPRILTQQSPNTLVSLKHCGPTQSLQ